MRDKLFPEVSNWSRSNHGEDVWHNTKTHRRLRVREIEGPFNRVMYSVETSNVTSDEWELVGHKKNKDAAIQAAREYAKKFNTEDE